MEAVHSCVEYLARHNQHVQAQHASPIHVQCADDFSDMRTIPAVVGPVGEEYIDLDKALSDLPLYKAVCLNYFCPDDRYRWKVWLSHLSLPYPIKEYWYVYGNQLGTVSFAWKISETENETSLARVVSVVTGQLRVYATCEMKHHFVSRYSHIRHLTKSLLREVYRETCT